MSPEQITAWMEHLEFISPIIINERARSEAVYMLGDQIVLDLKIPFIQEENDVI